MSTWSRDENRRLVRIVDSGGGGGGSESSSNRSDSRAGSVDSQSSENSEGEAEVQNFQLVIYQPPAFVPPVPVFAAYSLVHFAGLEEEAETESTLAVPKYSGGGGVAQRQFIENMKDM